MIENKNQLFSYLNENEVKASRGTVYNQSKFGGKLEPTWVNGEKKGKWDESEVLKRAINIYGVVGVSPSLNRSASSHEDKAGSDARLKSVQADKITFNFDRERGKYLPITVLHGELSARARVFRMSLEKWGMDRSAAIADIFGGGADESHELCEMLNVDPVKFSPIIVEFTQSQTKKIMRMWSRDVDGFLDGYSYGRFLTAEAEKAFLDSEQAFEPVYDLVLEEFEGLIDECRSILGDSFRDFIVYNAVISAIMERSK